MNALRTSACDGAPRTVHLLLVGAGTVGGALLQQLAEHSGTLLANHELEPVLVGVCTTSLLAWDDAGLQPGAWRDRAVRRLGGIQEPDLDRLARLPAPILVDCTAADGMERLHRAALERGIHVVTANKKPLTTPVAVHQDLFRTARSGRLAYQHETTVGAALPVIASLRDLIQTGDEVIRIEGSLSGTLGYLCDQLSRGVPIDEAVRDALERGYTEPRPQEDLGGTDAARKALILARHLALPLEIDQVQVEPLVPAELLAIEDVDAFLDALAGVRDALAERVRAVREAGQVLRYLAVVDPSAEPGQQLRVGPVAVDAEHPAFGLSGSQSMVAFTTGRYRDQPLVVAGAGAGGAVTASGVLADVLRIAEIAGACRSVSAA